MTEDRYEPEAHPLLGPPLALTRYEHLSPDAGADVDTLLMHLRRARNIAAHLLHPADAAALVAPLDQLDQLIAAVSASIGRNTPQNGSGYRFIASALYHAVDQCWDFDAALDITANPEGSYDDLRQELGSYRLLIENLLLHGLSLANGGRLPAPGTPPEPATVVYWSYGEGNAAQSVTPAASPAFSPLDRIIELKTAGHPQREAERIAPDIAELREIIAANRTPAAPDC